MAELIKAATKFLRETLVSYVISDRLDDKKRELRAYRLRKILIKSIKDAGERNGRKFSDVKLALSKIPEEKLIPTQTKEELEKVLQGVLDAYILDGSEDDVRLMREILEGYLNASKDEIIEADIAQKMEQWERLESELLRSIQSCVSKIDKNVVDVKSDVTDIKEVVEGIKTKQEVLIKAVSNFQGMKNGERPELQVAESTKQYQKMFDAELFLEKDDEIKIKLSDVYIEPRDKDDVLASEKIEQFLTQNKVNLLFVQGAPGGGKSSLFAMLASRCIDDKSYFMRLSSKISSKCEDLATVFERMASLDDAWKRYERGGNILYLDGYDEVSGVVSHDVLAAFADRMRLAEVKVIVSGRPGYFDDFENNKYKKIGYQKIELAPYSYECMEEWIENYLSKKNYSREMIDIRKNQLNCKKSDQELLKVFGMPIFLYIVQNQGIEMDTVSSLTELYSKVFARLEETRMGERVCSEEAAKYLGYYMQAYEITRFGSEYKDNYDLLIDEQIKNVLKDMKFDALLGNVFLKIVTEGEVVREFYHKTIQEYFAAKYIFEKIQTLKSGEEYARLLDKQRFKEEIPHLRYFIETWCHEQAVKSGEEEDDVKEQLATTLQNWFEKALKGVIPAQQENWFQKKERYAYGTMLGVGERNALLWENHMRIMHDIFTRAVLTEEQVENGDVLRISLNFMMEHKRVKEYSHQYQPMWDAFRYTTISEKVIEMLGLDKSRIFEDKNHICHMQLEHWNLKTDSKGFMRPRLWQCHMKDFHMHGGDLGNMNMEKVDIEESSFQGGWNYSSLEDVHMIETKLDIQGSYLSMEGVWFEKCPLENCIFQYGGHNTVEYKECEIKNMSILDMDEMENIRFNNCEYDNLVIKDCNSISGMIFVGGDFSSVVFENCDLDHVTFLSCTGFYIENFINCSNLKSYNFIDCEDAYLDSIMEYV